MQNFHGHLISLIRSFSHTAVDDSEVDVAKVVELLALLVIKPYRLTVLIAKSKDYTTGAQHLQLLH